MTFFRAVFALLVCVMLCACATPARQTGLELQDIRKDRRVITYDLPETTYGRMVIDVGLADGRTLVMLLDTGATRSAIFESERARFDMPIIDGENMRIHGMIGSGLQPVVKASELRLQGTVLRDVPLAVLKDPESEARAKELHGGILGMDVLSQFHLYVDGKAGVLRLIPTALGTPRIPVNWKLVELEANPFFEDGRLLHFFKLRLGNSLTPALLDTGSEFNLMNWNTSRFPQLRAVKRRLRDTWVIEGATGQFDPVTKIRVEGYRAGQKFWKRDEFIVLDFNSLDILGIGGKPFVIIGASSLQGESYILDFQANRMAFAPNGEKEIFQNRGAAPVYRQRVGN